MTGLRERRRRETIRLIHRAALRLAADQAFEAVTVEAICAEAGVSVRTFFNYFPVKEAAFVVGPPPFPDEAVTAFLGGSGVLLDDLGALLASRLPRTEEDRAALRLLGQLFARQDRIAAMQISAFHANERDLTRLIAGRLGEDEESARPRIVAAAALATTRVVLGRWAQAEAGPSAETLLRAALEDLRTLLAAG